MTEPSAPSPQARRKVQRTFVGIDLVGFTAATDVHGDEVAATIAMCLADCSARSLDEGDELVKLLGDGALLASPDARSAIALVGRLRSNLGSSAQPLAARIGVHSGTAVDVGGDYIGGAVNQVARITSAARPGQVLLSGAAAEDLEGAGMPLRQLAPAALRHLPEAVGLYELQAYETEMSAALDPVCHMRLDGERLAVTLIWRERTVGFCSETCAERFAENPDEYLAHLEDC